MKLTFAHPLHQLPANPPSSLSAAATLFGEVEKSRTERMVEFECSSDLDGEMGKERKIEVGIEDVPG